LRTRSEAKDASLRCMVKQQSGHVSHPHVPQGDPRGHDQYRALAAGERVAIEADGQLYAAEIVM
jgi:hypothetical protein